MRDAELASPVPNHKLPQSMGKRLNLIIFERDLHDACPSNVWFN